MANAFLQRMLGPGGMPLWRTPPFLPTAQGGGPPGWSTPPFLPTGGGPLPQVGGGGTVASTAPNPPLVPTYGKNMPRWLQKFSGGFNKFANNFAGVQNNPNLSPQENEMLAQQQRMAMTAALLQGAAPRPQGTGSPLADLGSAMFASQQAGNQFTADAMRTKLMQAQIAQANQQQDPRVSAAIGDMAALGIPLTKEGFAEYNKLKGSDSPTADRLAEMQAQLAVDARRDQIARDRAADEKAATEAERTRVQTGNTLRRSITQTADIAALTEKLEGSFLEAGMPASSWRRTGASLLAGAGSALGMDTKKLESDLANFDKLKKGMSDQLNNLLSTGSLGQPTNDKLQAFRDALANTETSPGAIMSIQAGIAEALLEEADAQGIEIEGRDKVEANIARWRAYESPSGDAVVDVPGAARSAADFSRMTVDQLRSLDPGKMTKEMLEAAQKRWDELNNAR